MKITIIIIEYTISILYGLNGITEQQQTIKYKFRAFNIYFFLNYWCNKKHELHIKFNIVGNNIHYLYVSDQTSFIDVGNYFILFIYFKSVNIL